MLSRHFLRATVLQSLYASEYSEIRDVVTAEKNFTHNIHRLNDLGIIQVSTLVHLREVAEIMIEEGRQKYRPTEEEKNPSLRLINNIFLCKIADNYDFRSQVESHRVNWNNDEDLFRKAFTNFRKTQDYIDYIAGDPAKGASTEGRDLVDEDKQLMLKLFKFLMNDEALTNAFIDKSLLWEDDFYQVAQYLFMYLKALDADNMDEATPWALVYDERNETEREGFDFARQLLLITLRHRDENDDLIRKYLKGWEFERVSLMDILLINMAITELTECPSIPERVTVDEYIELSKEFSSDRSKLFVNGILDKLILELRSAGKIRKSGRGILDVEK